jgi:hypothetical protein
LYNIYMSVSDFAEIGYFVPEGSKRIDDDENHLLSATWERDGEAPDLEPGVVETLGQDWGAINENSGLVPDSSVAHVYEFNFENEDYRTWMIRNIGQMSLAARNAAYENATSYRGMKIGVTVMALSFDKSRIAFVSQGNHKADENDSTNCGEMNLLNAMTELLRYDHIAAFCIAGPNQHQKTTEHGIASILGPTVMPSKTLFPCFRCDDALEGSDLVTPRTEIVTLPKNLGYYQHQTQGEYHNRQARYVATGEYDEPDIYRFTADPNIWNQNAELYEMLRDRRNLRGSDYDDTIKRIEGRNVQISRAMHIGSVHYNEL